jgi:hypothetical protein
MRCRVCGLDKNGMCLCGYCLECIEAYGHFNCEIVIRERKENEK